MTFKIIVAHGLAKFEKTPVEEYGFRKLPIIVDEIQKLVKKTMLDEWWYCMGLDLHLARRPLFILICRCRSKIDWACSKWY